MYIRNAHRLILMAGLLSAAPALAQQAGVTQADPPITLKAARKVALARVPGGKIQEEKLEREHGRLVYSFEIAQGTSEIQEVEVDANDGAVISGQQEDDKQDEKAGEHEDAEERSSGKESGQQR